MHEVHTISHQRAQSLSVSLKSSIGKVLKLLHALENVQELNEKIHLKKCIFVKHFFLEQVMKPQELLFPTQTFFSVVWTKSNMLMRELTTTVSE